MADEMQEAPFAEFLDDYFAECDEHLTAIRRALLALESSADRTDAALLDELFRGLHTIKGLSGMVGLTAAEQLAHRMESYLRALREGQLTLTDQGIETLAGGTNVLENVIAARRTGQAAPDIASVLNQLDTLIAPVAADTPGLPVRPSAAPSAAVPQAGLSPAEQARLDAVLGDGARGWLFRFTPSPELAERGITVDVIRERLQACGELVRAAPQMMPGGGIAFEFLVAVQGDEAQFQGWQDDGLTWTLYEPAPAPSQPGREIPVSAAPATVVRVDLARLDDLMQMVGELVITRARMDEGLKTVRADLPRSRWRELQEVNQTLERQLRDLREGIMRTRMVPISTVFERMRFVLHDLARESGKQINLTLSGQETEIDKMVVERMMDPLLHLVRNAVSHGVESPQERRAQNKPSKASVALRARTVGDTVVIEVEDDGRGIDAAQVAARAQAAGFLEAGEALDADALLDVLCAPGFSTRDRADRASGRGVGMAVVRNAVTELGGSLHLDTQVGRGTRFTIQLPITLAITDALIIAVGGQPFAVPLSVVHEVIEVQPQAVTELENNQLLLYRGDAVPLLRLARLFGLQERWERACYALIVGGATRRVALAVDRILGQREIVVRAITDPLIRTPGVAGATELGDGRPILILDVNALIAARRAALETPERTGG